MRIPSYKKIEKQIAAYVSANLPDISHEAKYKALDHKIILICRKYRHIQEMCEATRKNVSECLCKSHSDYLRYQNEITPLINERDAIVDHWQLMKRNLENEYGSFLLKSKKAKLEYLKNN